MKRTPRERQRPLRVVVSTEERSEIEKRAAEACMSVSGYLRAAGLNHRTRSVYDLDAVADLVRVNGDLGRVAGLLKLWLVEKPGEGASRLDVRGLMDEFRTMQAQLSAIMGKAVKGR